MDSTDTAMSFVCTTTIRIIMITFSNEIVNSVLVYMNTYKSRVQTKIVEFEIDIAIMYQTRIIYIIFMTYKHPMIISPKTITTNETAPLIWKNFVPTILLKNIINFICISLAIKKKFSLKRYTISALIISLPYEYFVLFISINKEKVILPFGNYFGCFLFLNKSLHTIKPIVYKKYKLFPFHAFSILCISCIPAKQGIFKLS